jgi:hypothetical protein
VTRVPSGAPILPETKEDAMEKQQRARVHRLGAGYCYEARGVYLWDEDKSQVERALRALATGRAPEQPTRRMLVIPPQDITPAAR